jgi:hypothetical protein
LPKNLLQQFSVNQNAMNVDQYASWFFKKRSLIIHHKTLTLSTEERQPFLPVKQTPWGVRLRTTFRPFRVVYKIFCKKDSERLVMACRVIDKITFGKNSR